MFYKKCQIRLKECHLKGQSGILHSVEIEILSEKSSLHETV